MSVTSIRAATRKALADDKISYSEASDIVKIAKRTKGIDAAERAELAKLAKSPKLDSGAQSVFESAVIRSTPGTIAPQATRDTVRRLVESKGPDVFSGLQGLTNSELPKAVQDSLERFSGVLDMQDGTSIPTMALGSGRDRVVVAADYNGDKKELFGFFDMQGREIGRASLVHEDEKITMRWEGLDGKPGKLIASYGNGGERVPAAFKKDLTTYLKGLEERPTGKEVSAKALPDILRRHYEIMQRTIADGTSAETFTFQGQKLYLLNDWSCVSTQHVYTAKGTELATVVDGEVS